MAHSNNSAITGKLSGSINKELVFRDWDGKTVVAKSPKKSKATPDAAALARREKFQIASRYAKSIIDSQDKSMAEAYAASLRPRQNAYSRALEDFIKPPVVEKIETREYTGVPGNKIVVRSWDDFRLKNLRVEIFAGNGTLLESGNATQNDNGIDWTYTATVANSPVTGSKIKAVATDVPGNEGMLEIVL